MIWTIVIILAVVVGIPFAWYTLVPFFRVIKKDDVSPLSSQAAGQPGPIIADNFEEMKKDPEMMKKFEDAVAQANQMTEIQKQALAMDDPMPGSAAPSPQAQTTTPTPVPATVQPAGPRLLAQANLIPRAHEVQGRALLIEADGKKILRFEDLETLDGPNLHVFLAADLGNADSIDLGRRKATEGNVNYELPANIDTNKYNKVLYWCVPFHVLFSYAELQ